MQLAADGYVWSGVLKRIKGCYLTEFYHADRIYCSVYVPPALRNQGLFKRVWEQVQYPIVTVNDCNVTRYLDQHSVPYVCVAGTHDTHEYKLVQDYYASRIAKRSRVHLMNHIDEGIIVMRALNPEMPVDHPALKAYCLHPLTQGDGDLANTWELLSANSNIDTRALVLAMEYRNIANQYLSARSIDALTDIALSPISDVNWMLKGDKIQNYKDFIGYHLNSHDRSVQLQEYFQNWLQRLLISPDQFNVLHTQLVRLKFPNVIIIDI
jgi:hypothetical protein